MSVFFNKQRLFGVCHKCISLRREYVVERKNPVDPEHFASLPVHEYGVGSATDRKLYVWGLVEHGGLGVHHLMKKRAFPPQYYQRPSSHNLPYICKIKDIACGYGFSLFAVKKDKVKLLGCGINTDAQVGYHAPRRNNPLGLLKTPSPIDLPLQSFDTNIIKVAAGRAHSLALSDEEGLFTFGNNAYGQCGRPAVENENYLTIQNIHRIPELGGEKIVDICCGQDHSLFLTDSGRVWSCGWSADGQTGLGHFNSIGPPNRVSGAIVDEKIVKLSSKGDFALALNDKGDVFGWGNNEYKQLMLDDVLQIHTPIHLSQLRQVGPIVDIGAGGSFAMAVNDKGLVYVWGFGLLGGGPALMRTKEPFQIPATLFGRNQFDTDVFVKSVSCGLFSMSAITNNGHLYTWGRNKGACLGLGHTKDQYFPLKVAVGAHVLKAVTGVDHTLALCKPFA